MRFKEFFDDLVVIIYQYKLRVSTSIKKFTQKIDDLIERAQLDEYWSNFFKVFATSFTNIKTVVQYHKNLLESLLHRHVLEEKHCNSFKKAWISFLNSTVSEIYFNTSKILGKFFSIFVSERKIGSFRTDTAERIRKMKAKLRKTAHQVIGTEKRTDAFVYNVNGVAIARRKIINQGTPPCGTMTIAVPATEVPVCIEANGPKPLRSYPQDVVLTIFSETSDKPIFTMSYHHIQANNLQKLMEVGVMADPREEGSSPSELPTRYVVVSYFLTESDSRDSSYGLVRRLPKIELGVIPRRYLVTLSWTTKDRYYSKSAWRTIVQPPVKPEKGVGKALSVYPYQTSLDNFLGDFALTMFLVHDTGAIYSIEHIDLKITQTPRDRDWVDFYK